MNITGVGFDYNAATVGTALNWQTMVDTDETGTFTATPLNSLTVARRSVTGTVDVTDLFGVITGTVTFDLASTVVDVDTDNSGTPDLLGAELSTTKITLGNVTIGDPTGVRFTATGGTIDVASISKTGDPRRWTALSGSITGAKLLGITGLTLEAASFTIGLNQASPAADRRAELEDRRSPPATRRSTSRPRPSTPPRPAPRSISSASSPAAAASATRSASPTSTTSTGVLTGATLSVVTVTLATASAGVPSGVRFGVTGGSLTLANVQAGAQQFTAIKATLQQASSRASTASSSTRDHARLQPQPRRPELEDRVPGSSSTRTSTSSPTC